MREEFVEAVLDVAALIPAGKVLSYGDIAELLGAGGPRQVGAVMARHGSGVPWWRVVRADGTLPAELREAAGQAYRREATALAAGKVRMAAARWQPTPAELMHLDRLGSRLSAQLHEPAQMSVPDGGV